MSHVNTFIRVATDCPTKTAEIPITRTTPTVAAIQYRVLRDRPYCFSEEELYVRVFGYRRGMTDPEVLERYDALHAEVYAKPQACLRASPLTKRYGYGAHYDESGRIALHPVESDGYARLAADARLQQLNAMRCSRP